jgi:hypothetical protein
VREEGRLLEHDADPALLRMTPAPRAGVTPDILAEADRAGVGPLEPGNLPQDRRLPRTRRPEQHEHRAGAQPDVERGADDEPAGEALLDLHPQDRPVTARR